MQTRMRDRSSDHWEAGLRMRAERPGGGGGAAVAAAAATVRGFPEDGAD